MILKYSNLNYINEENIYEDIISDGMILDLTDLTSEKEVFSYSVYYFNSNKSEKELIESEMFFTIEHTDYISFDNEYCVYMDVLEGKLFVRYYEFGSLFFEDSTYVLARIPNPFNGWDLNEGIFNCGVIIKFNSFNGNVIKEYEIQVYSKDTLFQRSVPDFCLIDIDNGNGNLYNFILPFNKLSVSMILSMEAETAVAINEEYRKVLNYEEISNADATFLNKPWCVFGILGFDFEEMKRTIIIYWINSLYFFSISGEKLFYRNLDSGPEFETFEGEYNLYTENGGLIEGNTLNKDDVVVVKNSGNEGIGFKLTVFIENNVQIFYTDEV